MEWLAVARARTPSVPATTRAETTSHTFGRTRISGEVCNSRSVRARDARSGMPPKLDRMSAIVMDVSGIVMGRLWRDHLGEANLLHSACGGLPGTRSPPGYR